MIQDGTVRDAEIGTTGNASGDGQKRPHKSARSGDRRQEKNAGLRLELDSLKIEYQNLFDRSNKLDNKVFITITFCGFLFVFITGLFSKISQLPHVGSGLKGAVTVSYILTCMAVMVSYVYLLIYFMRLLQPEQIVRMDPEILKAAGLEGLSERAALERLIGLYRDTVDEDLIKLKTRCDEFTRGLRFVVPTVILAFVAYAMQLAVQII